MSTSSVQGLISSDQIYPVELYRAAEAGSTCQNPKISIESTNVIKQILSEMVIDPLSEIPDLARQVEKGKLDTATTEKVERIFRAIGFTPSKTKGPRLEGDRKDLALRTANLFRLEYKSQLGALALYLFRSRKFSKDEAFQSILASLSSGSLSDAVGNKALDVFKADLVIQKERSAAAKDYVSRRNEFMINAIALFDEIVLDGKGHFIRPAQ